MGEYQGPAGRVVEVAAFRTDSRFRPVWLLGVGWMSVIREAFEATVHQLFPALDLHDGQPTGPGNGPADLGGTARPVCRVPFGPSAVLLGW